MNTFLGSLKVMGLGMLGIFIVTIVLIVIMMLLTKIFPARKNSADSIKAANAKEGKACSQTTAQTGESKSHNDTDR